MRINIVKNGNIGLLMSLIIACLMKKLIAFYQTTAVILTNVVIVFIAVNLLAMLIPAPYPTTPLESLYYTPLEIVETREKDLQRIYEIDNTQNILQLLKESPGTRSHSVLEFATTLTQTANYWVGYEHSRYHAPIVDSNFYHLLNSSIWVFGGSTTFGFGVSNNRTIPYFLDSLDSKHTYINFGSLGYHQHNEIEKLILLLQKGYRPLSVIFIDGLNDVYKISESQFEALETPSRFPNAYANDFTIGSSGYKMGLIYSLPIIKLFYQYLAQRLLDNGTITAADLRQIDHPKALYNAHPILHYYAHELLSYKAQNPTQLAHKLLNYYRSNSQLIDALSKAYGFEYTLFLQPVGPLFDRNPFIKDIETFKSNDRLYKNIQPTYHTVQQAIKRQTIPHFYDISFAHYLASDAYVDLTHYTPTLNRIIAQLILQKQRELSTHGNTKAHSRSTLFNVKK